MDRTQINEKTAPHVVLLHQGALGDFLLTLSLVQPLDKWLIEPFITAIASNPVADFVAGQSVVNTWYSTEAVRLYTLFGNDLPGDHGWPELIRETDLVISFLGEPDSRVHKRLNRACPGKVISIDPRPTEKTLRDRNHITMQWWRDIRKQEPHYPEPSPPIVFRRSPDSQSKYRVSSEVVIHPGSGGCEKCWPWEKFLQLADALTDLQAITWMLGPVEMERMPLMCDALQARCAASNDTLILETDLKEAADYLRRARLFIGNDGGMTHLAAALGIETIAIYGPTDPRVWRPLGNHVHAVSTENVGESIEKITVEQVIQKYRQLKL